MKRKTDNNRVSKRRYRRALVTCCCVLILLVAGGGIALWHPWDSNLPDAAEKDTYMDVSDVPADKSAQDSGDSPENELVVNPNLPSSAEEGHADGEIVVSGPTRESFDTEEEWLYYEANWHTDDTLDPKTAWRVGESGKWFAGEVAVDFEASVSDERIAEIASGKGASVKSITSYEEYGFKYAVIYFLDDYMDVSIVADELEADYPEEVRDALPNVVVEAFPDEVEASAITTDLYLGSQSYVFSSGFVDAWDVSKCNGTVTVAVLDSGINMDHEDLIANIDASHAWDVSQSPAVTLSSDFVDFNGHGTAVSGIVSAVSNNGKGVTGCSYNAKILPVKVFTGASKTASAESVTRAFDYLLGLGEGVPEVVNMSFGAKASDLTPGIINAWQSKIDQLRAQGVVLVAAVGNDGDGDVATAEPLCYPAALDGVIGVGSLDSSGNLSGFSNVNSSVDLCAPGELVYTTVDPASQFGQGSLYADRYAVTELDGESGNRGISGTSFSAPQVAAAAALVKAKYPNWSADQVKKALWLSAQDLGIAGVDDVYGLGALSVASAAGMDGVDLVEYIVSGLWAQVQNR